VEGGLVMIMLGNVLVREWCVWCCSVDDREVGGT
jgi:hypothetical protein